MVPLVTIIKILVELAFQSVAQYHDEIQITIAPTGG
jgi:hypothetical protein